MEVDSSTLSEEYGVLPLPQCCAGALTIHGSVAPLLARPQREAATVSMHPLVALPLPL